MYRYYIYIYIYVYMASELVLSVPLAAHLAILCAATVSQHARVLNFESRHPCCSHLHIRVPHASHSCPPREDS